MWHILSQPVMAKVTFPLKDQVQSGHTSGFCWNFQACQGQGYSFTDCLPIQNQLGLEKGAKSTFSLHLTFCIPLLSTLLPPANFLYQKSFWLGRKVLKATERQQQGRGMHEVCLGWVWGVESNRTQREL